MGGIGASYITGSGGDGGHGGGDGLFAGNGGGGWLGGAGGSNDGGGSGGIGFDAGFLTHSEIEAPAYYGSDYEPSDGSLHIRLVSLSLKKGSVRWFCSRRSRSCTATRASAVTSIRPPADATHAGAGHVTLADGASFEITMDDKSFLVSLHTAAIAFSSATRLRNASPDAGSRARMAIAGNTRTGDSVYELAYPAHTVETHAASDPAPYAMLVPTTFDGIAIDGKRTDVIVVKTHGADRYRIRVDFAPQCNGANVCSAGAFSGYGPAATADGHVIDPPDGPLTIADTAQRGERPVKLADGTTAFYSQTFSGAGGGGNSALRFVKHGTLYVITSRPSTPASLVATANSAMRNGPGAGAISN